MIKKIYYFTSFGDLGPLYTSFGNFFEELTYNFDKVVIINSDNLKICNSKKNNKNLQKIRKKFSKKVKFFNPKSLTHLNTIINFENSVVINNFDSSFNYYSLLLFLSKINAPQVMVSHTGYIQGSVYYFWNKNFNYLILMLTKQLPKKLYVLFAYLGIFKKIDIRFTSNKKLFQNFISNKKRIFKKPTIYKEMILVKSRQFDEPIKVNKEQYITLIDFQPDYREMREATGDFSNSKIDHHYKNIINLLNLFKKIYKKKIIICIHPLYDIKKISRVYKDFKVFKYRTKEFIKKSFIVMFYDSSSLVDAIVQKKKIIALESDLYKGKKNLSSLWTDIIPFKTINISKKIKFEKTKLIKELDNKISLYDKYLVNFGSNDQAEKGNKKIIRILKERFF